MLLETNSEPFGDFHDNEESQYIYTTYHKPLGQDLPDLCPLIQAMLKQDSIHQNSVVQKIRLAYVRLKMSYVTATVTFAVAIVITTTCITITITTRCANTSPHS
mgnify:CR=1 FL=1